MTRIQLILAFRLLLLDRADMVGQERGFLAAEQVRASSYVSCAEIAARFIPHGHGNVECGAGHIPDKASLEVSRRFWDPATRSWEWVMRCGRPQECLPFLLRASEGEPPTVERVRPTGPRGGEKFLVRAGESVRLTWDQEGIRVEVKAVCLDRGRAGETVRARAAPRGRVFRAIVVGPGKLQVQ